jgi:hypothetical protein
MGAGTGNLNKMGAAQQQQVMEGQAMRRRALQQQEQYAPTQEQGVTLEMSTPEPQTPMVRNTGMNRMPEMRSGIDFGPGRADRVPEQSSPEYAQLLQRVRGLSQGRR